MLCSISPSLNFSSTLTHFLRMRNTGPGERRTTWQQSVLEMHGGWKRTRSRCEPPSWNGKTQRYGSKWLNCGRTAVAARTSLPDMRLSTAHCKELRIKPTKFQWDKKQNSLPRRIQHRHRHQGNLNLHCCLCWPPVTVSNSESFGYTLAGREAWWELWSQEGLWRAPGSYTERGRGRLWILPWLNIHGKYGPSQDGFNKVRKHEKSR